MEIKKQPKKMGRPVGSTKANPMSAKILVQVTPEKLAAYKEAAKLAELSFSAWVRSTLDKGSARPKSKSR